MAEASESSGLRRTVSAFAAVLKEKEPPLPAELAEVMGEASIEEESARRMLVYRSLVRRGIAGAIKAQIPGTAERLGSEMDAWITRWLDEELPASPYLRDVAGEFVAWAAPKWFVLIELPQWLGDYARHEVATFEVRAAPSAASGGERGKELELDRGASFDPAARIERYAWAVQRTEAEEGAPRQTPTALLMYRDEAHEVQCLELTRIAAAILERLFAGSALRGAIVEACAEMGQALDDSVLRATAELLADLGERGVLLGAAEPAR